MSQLASTNSRFPLCFLIACFLIQICSPKLLPSISSIQQAHKTRNKEKLLNELFVTQQYDKRLQPGEVFDADQTDEMRFNAKVRQIVEFDLKKQYLSSVVVHEISWEDWRLSWTPEDHGNATHLHVSCSDIWIPHIALSNGFDNLQNVACSSGGEAYVDSHGNITVHSRMDVQSSCPLKIDDFTGYPQSKQTCTIDYAISNKSLLKLTFVEKLIDSSTSEIDVDDELINHPCWNLISANWTGKTDREVALVLKLQWKSEQSICMSIL